MKRKGTLKEYLKVNARGGVSGTKLLQSKSVYPARMITAIVKAFESSK